MYFEEEKNGAAPVSYAAMETITPDSYNVSQLASSDDVYEAPEIDASGMEFIELGSVMMFILHQTMIITLLPMVAVIS